jgi:Protein of unknown function (DUF4242)
MDTYVIRRRNGWRSAADLQEAGERSRRVGNEEMGEDIRWIRSYVVQEEGGSLGTICIYEGSSAEKVAEHASRSGLPADEVLKVLDTVLVRADPVKSVA